MKTNPPSLEASSTVKSEKRASKRGQRLRLSLYIGLPVLIAGAVALWTSQTPVQAASVESVPPAPVVTVASATERLIVDHAELLGRVAATETVELRPEVSGKINAVNLTAGAHVKAGQVLFEIDPAPYAAAVDAAKAVVLRAEARSEMTVREASRAKELYKKAAISSEEAELRQSLAAEAKADLLMARAALATAQIDLDRTQLRSPIDGRVSRAYVTLGNLVSKGSTLMTTIVSTGEAHVYVDVDATTIRRFRKAEAEGRILLDEGGNIPVQLRLDQGSDFSHAGHVESLDNRIDPETGSLTVRLLFPDERDELLPGSFVRVRLPVSDAENRIVVSERAIGTDQNQKYVLTVQSDSTVAYRKVTLGPVIDGERIITDGIVPGESVIINGLQRVRPGMTVNAESAATLDSTGLAQR